MCIRDRSRAPGDEGGGGGARDWGGAYGKACAHNEVVMFALRPFAPLEVLNTRVCSRAHPAPGNAGHDGCVEFLRAQCCRRARAMTAVDVHVIHHFDARGAHRPLAKREILARWPDARALALVWAALRAATLASRGRAPPRALLAAIEWALALGAPRGRARPRLALAREASRAPAARPAASKAAKVGRVAAGAPAVLSRAATVRVVAFLLGGDEDAWRHVAKCARGGPFVEGGEAEGSSPGASRV